MSKSAALLLALATLTTLAMPGGGFRPLVATDRGSATARLLPILRTPAALKAPAWLRVFDVVVPPVYA